MKIKSVFVPFVHWLKSTEMFARPSRQIPGKWKLYEYYAELAGELQNVKEDRLKLENHYWEIEFGPQGHFVQKTNLPVRFLGGIESCQWVRSKNYLRLLHPDDFSKNEEFQFAVERGELKLLKKDRTGRIELFGFFRKFGGKE